MNLINDLPKEINLEIQTHLDKKGAANYLLLSKTCNSWLSTNNEAWHKIFAEITFPKTIPAKKYLKAHAISSCSMLEDRIDDFKKGLQNGLTGKFILLFPLNPDSNLTFEVKFEAEMAGFVFFNGFTSFKPLKATMTKTYIYMNRIENLVAGLILFSDQVSYPYSSLGATTTSSYLAEVRGVNCDRDITEVFRKAYFTVHNDSALFTKNFHNINANWELQKLAMTTVAISSMIFFNWGST